MLTPRHRARASFVVVNAQHNFCLAFSDNAANTMLEARLASGENHQAAAEIMAKAASSQSGINVATAMEASISMP